MANIDDLDDDFILCNVCNNEYDEDHRAPKLLPCLHTLCNDCALNAAHGSLLKCSLCQSQHEITGELDFLKDYTMRNMMDMIRLQKKPSSIYCSDCPDGNKGEAFCKDCYVFLCTECTSAHKRTQLTRRHIILTLEELKSAGIGSFTRKEMCSLPGHEDQPFSFYCENPECQRPVCTQCVVNEHSQSNGHTIRSLVEIFEENKVLVERLVGELLSKISGVSSEAKMLETESEATDTKRFEINGQIDTQFDSFVDMLNARRKKLKQRVDVLCEDRKNAIKQQLDKLQKSKSDMENSCNYSSRMLVFTNKPEFLQLKDTVITKLSSLINTDFPTTKPDVLEIRFDACVDQDRFADIAHNVGEVRTNMYGEKEAPKLNGTLETSDDIILPYKGSPKHPPGKFTSNKFTSAVSPVSPVSPVKPTREVRITAANLETTKPSMESLKLDLQNETKPVVRGTKGSPTSENVLGRPLSLKSPVISPNKQPTSLGDFLNELHHQTREVIREKRYQWILESQTPATKDSDRQLPKAPNLPPALSPTRKSPGTPPYTPPSYVPQPQMYQLYNTTGDQSQNSGVQSPPTRDVTSLNRNGALSPTSNGKIHDNPLIQNTRKGQLNLSAKSRPVVPKLNLQDTSRKVEPTAKNISNGGVDQFHQNGDTEAKQQKVKTKSQSVTWKLDQKLTNELSLQSPKTPVLTESSYPDVKQPSPRKPTSDKLVVFGDVACPDFQMDPASAHHEREVSSDGRILRNKKTDMYSSTSFDLDLDNSLVQYKGAIGTIPFQEKGKFYYEVDVVYNIQQPLEETWLVFEIGLCRFDDIDMHHTVERHEFARSFYVARYPEDGKLTMEFWHNRDLLNFIPLSDNVSGIEMRITYGFLVDTRSKKWVVVDCNNNKVLHKYDQLDFTEPLYAVFGCYNPDLCTVEMTLKTGSEITMIPQCLKSPGYSSP